MANRSGTNLLICLLLVCITGTYADRCQSCFAGCQTFDDCDCEGDENSYCEAPYCYAKLEQFTNSEDGVSAIQKGCTNQVSISYLGCQFASDDRSIACFCSGDLCNSAMNLSSYETPDLPVITCCECNDDESGNELCSPQNCTRNCTGNYCYLDMVANAQGCGWGHPQLFHFIRAQDHNRWQHELTCAEYYDNYRNYMHGCTCSKNMCNVIDRIDHLSTRRRNMIQENKTHLCYSLYAQSETAIGADIYGHASMCPSNLCFLSWTSVEVTVDPDEEQDRIIETGSGEDYYNSKHISDYSLPTLRSNYEISAGCLFVDKEEKVEIGCTIEWSHNQHKPLTKHCICAEKLCNSFYLIDQNQKYTSLAPDHNQYVRSFPIDYPSEHEPTSPIDSYSSETLMPVTSAFPTSSLNQPIIDTSIPGPQPTPHPPTKPGAHYTSASINLKKASSFLMVVLIALLS